MHPALESIRSATIGTHFDGDLWLVGGAVRDELLGLEHQNDFDLVTRGSSAEVARLLFEAGVSTIAPVTYERFGTAMVHVDGVNIELVTARRESYEENSRKPVVEPATYIEDALRRDFTVNTLMRNVHSGQLWDPLGTGLDDLNRKRLRTPLEPKATFYDDPLRMLRAVRFRWKLGFEPVHGLYESIIDSKARLRIISMERIRDEFVKMLGYEAAPAAMQDLMQLELLDIFLPEFREMVDCEQGKYHHLDVWNHTLLVLHNVGPGDLILSLSALFHDVGKPPTRMIDEEGNTRFLGHETVGADMTGKALRRLRFPQHEVDEVVRLVKNHMRLGSGPKFTASAARRVIRAMGDQTGNLLRLVEADTRALRPGVRVMELKEIRDLIEEVQVCTPREMLESPLTGQEIMQITGEGPGPIVGKWKSLLAERVIEGELIPGDKAEAERLLRTELANQSQKD